MEVSRPIEKQRALIVLGMHRSGTSALSGVLSNLGVDLGPSLIGGSRDNEMGFWEHADLAQLNEWILQILGGSWESPCELPVQWWESEHAGLISQVIAEIIEFDFSRSSLWGIKDPRLCRLLPLWNAILTQRDNEPLYIIVLRNPREVAKSLSKRNRFSHEKSYLLWLRYVLEAERWTREHKRLFIRYEELLGDWRPIVSRIEATFGIQWPQRTPDIDRKIDGFLRPELRHHRVKDEHGQPSIVSDQELERSCVELNCVLQYASSSHTTEPSRDTFHLDDVMESRLSELVSERCHDIESSRGQNQITKTARSVASYLKSIAKNISLIIPTRNRQDEIVGCIGEIYESLAGPDATIIVLQDYTKTHVTPDELRQVAAEKGIDIIKYDPPFDVTLLNRQQTMNTYVIMYDFHFAYLAQLARYGRCRLINVGYGPNIVLSFKE